VNPWEHVWPRSRSPRSSLRAPKSGSIGRFVSVEAIAAFPNPLGGPFVTNQAAAPYQMVMALVRDALSLAVLAGLLVIAAACVYGWMEERRRS